LRKPADRAKERVFIMRPLLTRVLRPRLLAAVALLLAACDYTVTIPPATPLVGWDCTVKVSVDGTSDAFQIAPTSPPGGSEPLLYNDGGTACELKGSLSGSTVVLSTTEACGNSGLQSITLVWDVNSGTISGTTVGNGDAKTVKGTLSGSCVPQFAP
jgi:hypothetical protein